MGSNHVLVYDNVEIDPFNNQIINTQRLYSLDGRPDFLLINYNPIGYAIFYRETGEPLRFSLDTKTPSFGWRQQIMYAGPQNYFIMKGDNLVDIINNEVVNIIDTTDVANQIRDVLGEFLNEFKLDFLQ